MENLEEAIGMGRGAFILSGHFGNWEVGSQALAVRGYPQAMIVRLMDNPHVETFVSSLRTRFGNTIIPKKGAGRESIKVLNENGLVDILIDQYVEPSLAVNVPFLGIDSPTTPFLAKMMIRREAPVVPLFSYPEGKGYRVVLQEPIMATKEEREAKDVASLTARLNDVVSRAIEEKPHLWLWFHDRWGMRKGKRR